MAEEKRGYTISDIYQGGYSSMTPPDNAYINMGRFGMATDPRTANVLQEFSAKLSPGVKTVEISTVKPDVFDSIPKQQLKEVNRLSKLTGVDITMHAPLVEASGLDPRGGGFSEIEREAAERSIANALLRSHELNPDGNINVTFHSTHGLPGSQFLPPGEREKTGEKYKRLIMVNREDGKVAPMEPEVQYTPGMENLEKGEQRTPEQRMESYNVTNWQSNIDQLFFNQERANELLEKTRPFLQQLADPVTGEIKKEDFNNLPSETQAEIADKFMRVNSYIEDINQHVTSLFSKAYEFGDQEQKDALKKLNEEFRSELEKGSKSPFAQAHAMENLLNTLKSREYIPKMWVPVEDFAIEKSSESFGNAAFEAYKKYKKTAPIISIENPPAGAAISTAEDLKKLVEESRKKFVENAVKPPEEHGKGGLGMSKGEAEEQAKKLIGATWDVGHINMLRKFGYKEEDIVKESEKIAPVLKHVHLSDNFGFEHTELPMGMGNVPLKQIMEKLGEKGYDAKKIIEAGQWWEHFKTSPFQETLEATGSPIYGMKMAPYWPQAPALYQGYQEGLSGNWLPQVNYETFGTGFSRLPAELGGQVQGGQGSRMSGRPME